MTNFMGIVYAHLAGASAVIAASSKYPLTQNKWWPLISALLTFPLIFVLVALSPGPLKYIVFAAFCALLGQSLTPLVDRLGEKKVLDDVLAMVVGIFVAMSVAGFADKQNLLGFGGYLMAGLIGLILARLVQIGLEIFGGEGERNIALEMNDWLAMIGTGLFAVFVAYDTQVLKEEARAKGRKNYVNSSMGLLLDLVNLFANIGDLYD
jgi:FtsH-binding integral membrane protein